MSNNPQWKNFQSPIMNTDPAILDYKSMSIPSPKIMGGSNHHQSSNNYRNGTSNFGGDFMDSPPAKTMGTFGTFSSSAQTSPRNGTATFPIGNFSTFDANTNYSAEPVMTSNAPSYQPNEQTGNQGPRETGIIEKLLVKNFFATSIL